MVGGTISRYKLLEEVGAGGMGVVYRAWDEQLERDVAIKVLPAGMLADEIARRRFRQEALSLGRLNHPNVATVHEFGTQEGMDFLVTEFISGLSLDEKLRAGPLPEPDVLALGIQMAQGLGAAHERGVVHRDLKPANLRLTREGRLKILDFGLAQMMPRPSQMGLTRTVTQSQEVSGTLPYMAPEQLRGEPSDARCDIWATGAVLYEMATGKRAFPESNAPLLIDWILNRAPDPPRRLNPQISLGLETVILKALEKDASRRFQTTSELEEALHALQAGTPGTSNPNWWRWPAVALAAAAIGFGIYRLTQSQPQPSVPVPPPTPASSTPSQGRRSVAVMGFRNLSGKPETAWFSTALAEMLTTELALGDQLRTIPGESVAQMQMSMALPDAGTYSKETLAKIRQNLGTDEVILGSYVPIGEGQLRVDLRLQDTVAGETLVAVSEKGPQSRLDELVSRAGATLRQKLGVAEPSQVQMAQVKATLPASPEAARLYAEGLAKLRAADARGARGLLLKAVDADPQHAPSWAALSAAWGTLGYEAKALEAAQKAASLVANAPRQERLAVEAQYYEAGSETNKAIAHYKTLFEMAPDNPEYGLKLANVQSYAGKPNDALATIAKLRQLPSPQRDDVRIDLMEAKAAQVLSDFKRELAVAGAAADKAEAQGSRYLVAKARYAECTALRNLGNPEAALPKCEASRQVFADAGDLGGVANALNNTGNSLYDLGRMADATQAYEKSAEINRSIGNQNGLASALDNLASLIGDQGDTAKAQKLSTQALAIYRETGDRMNIAATLNNIAAAKVMGGDLEAGRKLFAEALQIGRDIGSETAVATAQVNLGDVQAQLGELDAARKAYEEALTLFRKNQEKGKMAYALVGLGDVASASGDLGLAKFNYEQGLEASNATGEKHEAAVALSGLGAVAWERDDLDAARKAMDDALALRRELNEKDAADDSELQISRLLIDRAQWADAEARLRHIVSPLNGPDLNPLAHAQLAVILAHTGKLPEAAQQIAIAKKLSSKMQVRLISLQVQTASARTRAASGKPQDWKLASQELDQVLATATKLGLAGPTLEARLTLAEIVLKSGRGTAPLESVEADAKAKGFNRIARHAAEARR